METTMLELYGKLLDSTLGLYRDNEEVNGNYYNGFNVIRAAVDADAFW